MLWEKTLKLGRYPVLQMLTPQPNHPLMALA